MNNSRKILSLDASTTSTGWAIFEGDKLTKYGVLKLPIAYDWVSRIKQEFVYLNEIITTTGIDLIVAESPPLKDGGRDTLRKLGAIQGMIITLGATSEIENVFMTPTEWRSRLGGIFDGTKEGKTRTKLKEKAVAVANETFGLNLFWDLRHPTRNQDDIAEAILIGWSHLHPAPEKEQKAFETKKRGRKLIG